MRKIIYIILKILKIEFADYNHVRMKNYARVSICYYSKNNRF